MWIKQKCRYLEKVDCNDIFIFHMRELIFEIVQNLIILVLYLAAEVPSQKLQICYPAKL